VVIAKLEELQQDQIHLWAQIPDLFVWAPGWLIDYF
jgi:hypothetical protein